LSLTTPRVLFSATAVLLLCALGLVLWPRPPAPSSSSSPRPVASPPIHTSIAVTTPPQAPQPSDTQFAHKAWIVSRKAELRTAFANATDITDPKKKNETLERLCYQWGEFDPRGAIDLAFDNHLDETGDGVVESLAMQWATVDLPATRSWIESQPPGEARADLVARIGFVWSQTEPEAAASFVLANIPPGNVQTEAAISVLYQWARRDPEAALAWARKFPPGPLRDRAIKEALLAAPREEN